MSALFTILTGHACVHFQLIFVNRHKIVFAKYGLIYALSHTLSIFATRENGRQAGMGCTVKAM
ncbi:hypothetical protein RNAN_1114 [Rheinheimera nanhaiensis E407-8]|uniref:Uncharacterized protein n=1 Tax=Rheinheimera nanhaiensis E407-8 TaxID=562729 RepID=I1DVR5_9GAMM|nr:hypothetical protein RNAN_1114 [Rheinheimera nanhaiensis E407-8]